MSRREFGSVVAVDDFSLAVEKGQFVTLLGSSGSGKSTTLMMLAGFTTPDDGVIRIDGRDVTELPPHQRNIGLVYQNYALFPHMTVAQNVGFPLRMRRMSRDAIARLVSETLAKVRLGELSGRFPLQLSGGQQQRVALARALVFSPSILLMDEPLGALDKNLREEMQFEIKRIQQEARITTIYVTHDQEEAMSMSDHVVVMSKGRIEQAAPPSQLYERPQNIFVANFIGSANVVSGVIENRDGRPILRSENGAVLALADGQVATSGSRMAAVIRPERISFASADKAGAVPANIESVVYGGSIIRYIVRIGRRTAGRARGQSRARTSATWRSGVPLLGSRGFVADRCSAPGPARNSRDVRGQDAGQHERGTRTRCRNAGRHRDRCQPRHRGGDSQCAASAGLQASSHRARGSRRDRCGKRGLAQGSIADAGDGGLCIRGRGGRALRKARCRRLQHRALWFDPGEFRLSQVSSQGRTGLGHDPDRELTFSSRPATCAKLRSILWFSAPSVSRKLPLRIFWHPAEERSSTSRTWKQSSRGTPIHRARSGWR